MTNPGRVAAAAPLVAALLLTLATARAGRGAEAAAPAEDHAFPGLGTRVRVTSSDLRSGPLVGTLTSIEEKSLAVQAQGRSEAVALDREKIRRFEWSVRPSRKKKGALIGLGVGFGLGLAGTFILCETFGTSCPVGEGLVFGTVYGVAVGAFGAGVGALASPGERWAEVSLDRIPSGGGGAGPRPRVQLSVLPMMGKARGLTIVASF